MKITVLAENLKSALTFTNHAISPRTQLPILSHILLLASNGTLSFLATDLEIGIQTGIPADIETEGTITVPAKLFLELVSSLPQEKVTLELIGTELHVITKKTKSVLQTTPSDEFPKLYEELGDELLTLSAKDFIETGKKIIFAASIESTRPALSGILLEKSLPAGRQEGSGIRLVATDGYRLSMTQIDTRNPELDSGSQEKKIADPIRQAQDLQQSRKDGVGIQKVLIPAKLIREALLLKDGDIHVYISTKSNQALFKQDSSVVVGRLIEAEFPSYEKIIPTDAATTTTFDREELLKAVKLCSIFARETANIVTLTLQKEKIIVKAQTPSLGGNTVEVEANLKGEENEIAFNARYLLDVLGILEDEEMTFEMTGPLNPGVFRIVGNPHFLHLIMPIRTQG